MAAGAGAEGVRMFNLPDLRPLFYLAFIGLLAIVVSIGMAGWWIWGHVSIIVH